MVLEAETFWVETEETDEPDETHPPRVTVSEDEKGEEESGCRLTAGNIFVIVIILAAAGLLWFVDLRRRSACFQRSKQKTCCLSGNRFYF